MSTHSKILASRFLTRFGDQAWDFAVPITLIQIFPGKIQLIAFFYFLSKLIQVLLGPAVTRTIDQNLRSSTYKLGIGSQTLAMSSLWASIYFINKDILDSTQTIIIYFAFLSILSAISNIGSSLMDVSVGLDLAVDNLNEDEITQFNSRLKRLDLITEVTAPLVAGLCLAINWKIFYLFGFTIMALINLATFIPEYILLRSVLRSENYNEKKISVQKSTSNFIGIFFESIKMLKGKTYSIIIFSYALLWLSVLSPHGVLLASYLKDGTNLNEFHIGIFRGLGAFFGLIPTFVFKKFKDKFGLVKTSKYFLSSQLFFILLATISFFAINNIILFLIFILFSRIGLYGFSIGETELRQSLIPASERGIVNGIANSITSMATLLLFLIGSLLSKTTQFGVLVVISLIVVLLANQQLSKFKQEIL